jgi:hypothetical protein
MASLSVEMQWNFAALRVKATCLRMIEVLRKYDPDQARIPAGNPDGGQWTNGVEPSEFESGEWIEPDEWIFGFDDQGLPPEEPPAVPSQRPETPQRRNEIIRSVARWAANVLKAGRSLNVLGALYEAASWLDTDAYFIDAYLDAPKSLEELNLGVAERKLGYDRHHIVEQTQARNEGYPESQINSPENLVRVPTLKHWEINGWMSSKSPEFGGLSPRQFLEGKSWQEKRDFGLSVLKKFGILKP